MSIPFSNTQLKDLFVKDQREKGVQESVGHPILEGEVSFFFCKIKRKTRPVQALLDIGYNTAFVKDVIPQKVFNAALLRPGLIEIDIATGIKVYSNSEWGMAVPLIDGSMQAVCCLSINQVMSDMPCLQSKPALDSIKAKHPEDK